MSKGDITNTTYDFGDGPVPAHRHKNPDGAIGGWVAETAHVAPTATVEFGATVSENARITKNAQVMGTIHIRGTARFGEGELISNECRINGRVFEGSELRRRQKVDTEKHKMAKAIKEVSAMLTSVGAAYAYSKVERNHWDSNRQGESVRLSLGSKDGYNVVFDVDCIAIDDEGPICRTAIGFHRFRAEQIGKIPLDFNPWLTVENIKRIIEAKLQSLAYVNLMEKEECRKETS